MVQIVDSMGREREALIAEANVTVTDPLTGTSRKIIAGQAVPGGLEDPYRAAAEESQPKPRTRRKKEPEDA